MAIRIFVLCLVFTACTQSGSATAGRTAIEPPPCTSVTQFGNGQTCSAKDATLANCGTSASRLCASGWLCYDDVAFEQCKCQTNADCAGKRIKDGGKPDYQQVHVLMLNF